MEIKIDKTKHSNDLEKHFKIKGCDDREILNDVLRRDIFNKILDVSDTIIVIKNRKDFYDYDFKSLEKEKVNIKVILRSDNISIHSNILENMKINCELNSNIYFLKFENYNDLNGFIGDLPFEFNVYTTLQKDMNAEINIYNSFNDNKNSFNYGDK